MLGPRWQQRIRAEAEMVRRVPRRAVGLANEPTTNELWCVQKRCRSLARPKRQWRIRSLLRPRFSYRQSSFRQVSLQPFLYDRPYDHRPVRDLLCALNPRNFTTARFVCNKEICPAANFCTTPFGPRKPLHCQKASAVFASVFSLCDTIR